jgi:glutaredoxin
MKLLAVASLLALAVLPAHAMYKIVGPDGRVTYTDRPPLAGQGHAVPMGRAAGGSSEVSMPLVLREAMTRFPVTLYTTADCQPCEAGRALLRQRGVPFQERTGGSTNADQEAWLRLTGSLDTPALTIGSQLLRGFSPSVWSSYLDTAGYPRESRLPANYQLPAATPLVEPAPPREATAPRTPPRRPPEPPPVEPAPGSIRF